VYVYFTYTATAGTITDDVKNWSCIEYLIPINSILVVLLLRTFLKKNADYLMSFNRFDCSLKADRRKSTSREVHEAEVDDILGLIILTMILNYR